MESILMVSECVAGRFAAYWIIWHAVVWTDKTPKTIQKRKQKRRARIGDFEIVFKLCRRFGN
ncbi:CLUMA_CG010612, isoform A [Clunio marinus]|uniref:CLUMA_CG010612, isoform A n=1 Tax=Clunio marinus TaxID=568069 RepID=A0A1J1IAA0_9DIPT|nr:CLUMA_CG010612, isoform A [Clunio marinus]